MWGGSLPLQSRAPGPASWRISALRIPRGLDGARGASPSGLSLAAGEPRPGGLEGPRPPRPPSASAPARPGPWRGDLGPPAALAAAGHPPRPPSPDRTGTSWLNSGERGVILLDLAVKVICRYFVLHLLCQLFWRDGKKLLLSFHRPRIPAPS